MASITIVPGFLSINKGEILHGRDTAICRFFIIPENLAAVSLHLEWFPPQLSLGFDRLTKERFYTVGTRQFVDF
ncbi:hypothetical protein, partial [Microseira wollei]|uniref:hypothetical protein n=1 Tax=Microseira wollei TaxID=467598 RepID=UPI001CFCC0F5